VDTLRRIHSEHPEWHLTLIMGEDQIQSFPRWREPEAIRALASLSAYRREGWDGVSDVEPDSWLRGEPVEMAATDIRDRIRSLRSKTDPDWSTLSDVLIPEVIDYIQAEGLYLPS